MENAKKTVPVKKILSIIGNTVLWVFVAFAILITVIVFASNNKGGDNSLPNVGGLAFVTIASESMEKSPIPSDYEQGGRLYGKKGFNKGSLIFVEALTDAEKNELKVGDVITFVRDLDGDGKKELNSHRIKEVHNGTDGNVYYVTQGDHNTLPDGSFDEATNSNDTSVLANGYIVPADDALGKWNGHKVAGLGTALDFLQTKTGFFVCIILPLIAFFLYELIRFVMVLSSVKGKKSEDEIRRQVMEELLRAQAQAQIKAEQEQKTAEKANEESPKQ